MHLCHIATFSIVDFGVLFSAGYFVYSDYTFAGPSKSVAQLVYSGHALAASSKPRCLQFHYFMSGHVGQLCVYAITTWSTPAPPVWKRHGNQGTMWIKGEIDIPPSVHIYRVSISN